MSQENVEVVLAGFDAYAKGDLDALMERWAPDIEVFPDASVFPEAEPLRGRVAYRRWLEEASSPWVRVEVQSHEVCSSSDGRVVQRVQWGGEGSVSGARSSASITGVFSLRRGLVSRVEWYFDHDEALKAVGLEE